MEDFFYIYAENGPHKGIFSMRSSKGASLERSVSIIISRMKIGRRARAVCSRTVGIKTREKTANSPYWRDKSPETIAVNIGTCYDLRTAISYAESYFDRSRGFQLQTPENRLLPLKAFITHTTKPYANARACDVVMLKSQCVL